jgi:hypothetical protein
MQVKAGFVMNIVGIAVMLAWTHSVGVAWFDLSEFPSWAGSALDDNSTQCLI